MFKKSKKFLPLLFISTVLGLFIFCVRPTSAYAATYYLDATNGDDSNSGTSTNQAWKSIDRIYNATFSAGDSVLLKRGEIFYGQIRMTFPGTAENPVTLGAYGTGEKPIVNGDFASVLTWTLVPGFDDVYKATVSNYPNGTIISMVVQGSTKLTRVSNSEYNLNDPTQLSNYLSLFNPGNYGPPLATNTIYVRTIDGLAPHDMKVIVSSAISIKGNGSYGIIQDLEISNSFNGIDAGNTDHFIIKDNYVHHTYGIGIYLRGVDHATNNIVTNNHIDTTGNNAIYFLEGSNNTASHNTINNVTNNINGVAVSGDQCGIGLQESENSTIEHNTITNVKGSGVDFYFEEGSTIRYNTISNPGAGGFYPHGTNLAVYGNIVDSKGVAQGSNANNTGSGFLNIYNNTFYNVKSGGFALMNTGNSGGGHVTYRNNIVYVSSANVQMTNFISSTDSDYNLFYWEISGKFTYNSMNYTSFQDYLTASGKDSHSLFIDPLFVDVSSGDFRLNDKSPAINAGIDVGIHKDIQATSIPQGLSPDMGAYEYIFSTSPSYSRPNLSSNPPVPPSCADLKPENTPKLFQIDTTKDKAVLYFSPSGNKTSSYVISYGYSTDDYRFGTRFDYSNIDGAVQYTINDLEPNKTYYFKVYGQNGCMPGDWSNTLHATTLSSNSSLTFKIFTAWEQMKDVVQSWVNI